MYLVSPHIYDKLLKSIDDKDRQQTMLLNEKKDVQLDEVKRPSEIQLDEITAKEISTSAMPIKKQRFQETYLPDVSITTPSILPTISEDPGEVISDVSNINKPERFQEVFTPADQPQIQFQDVKFRPKPVRAVPDTVKKERFQEKYIPPEITDTRITEEKFRHSNIPSVSNIVKKNAFKNIIPPNTHGYRNK